MRVSYTIFLTFLLTTLIISSCEREIEHNECSDLCKAYDETPFSSHGDCVSLCTTCFNPSESKSKMSVCICNYVEARLELADQEWEDFGVKNKGQCIKLVKLNFDDIEF